VVLLRKEVAKRTSALTKNKNMLNRIIDHVPHFIFVKNYDGVFVLVNKAMADYYDKKISVMVGKKLSEVLGDVSEDDSDFYLSRDREVITTNRDMIIPEETFRNNKGDLEIFRVHKTSIHIDGEEKPCALTIAVNMMEEISAKKELQVNQDALLRAELQLAESEKKATLGSMVGGITHEINNPIGISVTALSHIRFEHDIFKEKFENEKLSKEDLVNYIEGQDEGIRILQINIDRAVEMIQSFKMMSNDQLSEAKANFDLCDTINHVITSLHHQVKRKGHTITFVSECPIFITSYSGSYSQVFTNLILNSVVHGFENKSSGSIEIKVTREQDKIIMIYKDDGIGMTPEHLSKVFQPYFTTKRSQGGSGLGMQIIYNIIVRTLHGTINFDSKINEGVICTMKIPFNVSE
jgi:PAS domain S-box-containing protein